MSKISKRTKAQLDAISEACVFGIECMLKTPKGLQLFGVDARAKNQSPITTERTSKTIQVWTGDTFFNIRLAKPRGTDQERDRYEPASNPD